MNKMTKKKRLTGAIVVALVITAFIVAALLEQAAPDEYGNTSRADKAEAAAEAEWFDEEFSEQTFVPTDADMAYLEVVAELGTDIAGADEDRQVWEYHGAAAENLALLDDRGFMESYRTAFMEFSRIPLEDSKKTVSIESAELEELDQARWDLRAAMFSYVHEMNEVFEGDRANFDVATEQMYAMLAAMENVTDQFYMVIGEERK